MASKPLSGGVLAAGAIVLAAVAAQYALKPGGPLAQLLPAHPPAHTKPFATFEEFYPFYLKEHSDIMTKRLHYVGTALFIALMAASPALIPALAAGFAAGVLLFPFMRHVPSGLPEMVVMLGVYLACGTASTGSFRRALLPPLVGYAFAWVGHFAFEHNKPATFVYPTFSLLGDFRMLYDALVTRRVPL